MRHFATCLLFAAISHAAGLPDGERIRGGALFGGKLFTWGDTLRIWDLPGLKSQIVAKAHFTEGGCLVDLDSNGAPEFVSAEGEGLGVFTIRKAPNWEPAIIDREVESHDCTEATLFGRKGVLMVQRYMQVRFYEAPSWAYREIYSFYTASKQTGLVVSDVDSDGLPDILCGNYWIRSPKQFELPWKLYAIDTYHDTPEAAMSRFAVMPDGRVAMAQGHLQKSPVRIFKRRADPNELWRETALPFEFAYPHGIALHNGKLHVGENNGAASRLVRFDPKPDVVLQGQDTVQLLPWRGKLIVVGTTGVRLF